MGMLMTYRPGYFPGDALEDDDKRAQVEEAGARGETPGVEAAHAGERGRYDDLTDEQVAEAYATNVGGRATSRNGRVKALQELDAEGQPEQENPAPDASEEPGQPDPENDPADVDESTEDDPGE